MSNVNCRLCGAPARAHFTERLLRKYQATFCYCQACDHVFAQDPHWLDEAYADAIVKTDTDIAARNIFTALRLAAAYYTIFDERGEGRYVDAAGGYGLLTRLMRDLGFDCRWMDPYAENLFARGFEFKPGDQRCVAASAIEVLEHTVNPLEFVRSTMQTCQTDALLFTTMLFGDSRPPMPNQWDYYSLETGQHIAFFSRRGLETLAQRLGLHYYPMGRVHLYSKTEIPPHKLRLGSSRWMTLPLALFAARRLGSRRSRDHDSLVRELRQS